MDWLKLTVSPPQTIPKKEPRFNMRHPVYCSMELKLLDDKWFDQTLAWLEPLLGDDDLKWPSAIAYSSINEHPANEYYLLMPETVAWFSRRIRDLYQKAKDGELSEKKYNKMAKRWNALLVTLLDQSYTKAEMEYAIEVSKRRDIPKPARPSEPPHDLETFPGPKATQSPSPPKGSGDVPDSKKLAKRNSGSQKVIRPKPLPKRKK